MTKRLIQSAETFTENELINLIKSGCFDTGTLVGKIGETDDYWG